MRKRRTLVHTFYLIVIAVLVTLLYVERQPTTDVEVVEEAQSDNQVEALIAELKDDLDYRMQRLEDLLQASPQATAQSNYTQSQPMAEPIQDSAHMPAEIGEAPTPSALDALQHFTTNGQSDWQQRFDDEAVDPQWAYDMEDQLRDALYDDDVLAQLPVNDISCRLTLCRIELDHSAEGQAPNPAYLHRLLIEQASALGGSYHAFSTSDEDATEVFLIRTSIDVDDAQG